MKKSSAPVFHLKKLNSPFVISTSAVGQRGKVHLRDVSTAAGGQNSGPAVLLVDDDDVLLKSLTRLLQAAGHRVIAFSSAEEFLKLQPATAGCCLILDVAMPGIGGLELQQCLTRAGIRVPIIFLTGRSDVATSVRALKGGAADFLIKPVSASTLLPAVRTALQTSAAQQLVDADLTELRQRFGRLSPREREVLRHVVTGKLNKQIAADLGITLHTTKVHRGRIMVKLRIQAVADLVRIAKKLGVTAETTNPRIAEVASSKRPSA